MVLGMPLSTFTLIHVVISVIGILAGFVVIFGMFRSKRMNGMTAIFLLMTTLTSVTGFCFPNEHITPGIKIGIISMVMLVICVLARYAGHLRGASRWLYVVTALLAQYFNVFVLVVQSVLKIPALHALAPTGTETPFVIAEALVLLIFVVLGILAVKKFHPAAESV
jgi:hypothetical protein